MNKYLTVLGMILVTLFSIGCNSARKAPIEINADDATYVSCTGTVDVEKNVDRDGGLTYSVSFTEGTTTYKELHGVRKLTLTKNPHESPCDLMNIIESDGKGMKQIPPDADVPKNWEEAIKICPLGNYDWESGFKIVGTDRYHKFPDSDRYFDAVTFTPTDDTLRISAEHPLPKGSCKFAPHSMLDAAVKENWFLKESYHHIASDPKVFIGPTASELQQDNAFQSKSLDDRTDYLKNADPAFAAAAQEEKTAYLKIVEKPESPAFIPDKPTVADELDTQRVTPTAKSTQRHHSRQIVAKYAENLTTGEFSSLICGHVETGEVVTLLGETQFTGRVHVRTKEGKTGWADSGSFEMK